ncbi:MAG: hypothetical protein HRU24_11520 [Gammaproteobacteria bacterium]|nr:hypothetical protein [Gammaproteobacteria bacterium]
MKALLMKLLLALFIATTVFGCATTSSNQFACDFFDAAKDNIEIIDGRDKYGDTSKADNTTFIFDSVFGFVVASSKAIGRVFSTKNDEASSQCI